MADITSALVKELRERTGAGMMECKKALQTVEGDMDAAIEHLRKTGQAKADKKAGRTAAEGVIAFAQVGNTTVLAEVNCETDFVARGERLRGFAQQVAQLAATLGLGEVTALGATALGDGTVDSVRRALVAEIGEKIEVRRVAKITSDRVVGAYIHGDRIGVLVELDGGDSAVARDIAMHVAASRPVCVRPDQVPAEDIARERTIFASQAADSGKPPEIIAKMIDGRIKKFLGEITLLGQPFVKDPDMSVEKYLKQQGATALQFVRFELGEGIEKVQEDFVAAVMEQVRGSE